MTQEKHTSKNSGPLAYLGAELIDNGYQVVPIAVGKKAPGFDNWVQSRSTKPQLIEWVENGHLHSGVGILTKHTPGVDLDIRDEKIALEAEAKAREILGDAPLRIGMAPKRLLVYRTDTPFRKMRSNKYIDEWGELHQIEILCDGQQFVAYHTHPDTGKPYLWPAEEIDEDGECIQVGGPRTMPANALRAITVEKCQELIDWFEARAEQESDWKILKKRSNLGGMVDATNPFLEDTAHTEIGEDELRTRLMMVPNAEDYDTWIQVGMALYHQFDGDDIGLDMWREWAETADNYDQDALERRWVDFGIDGKKRAPITARYILKLSKEAVAETAAAMAVSLRDEFSSAKTIADWNSARDMAREAEIDVLTRSALAVLAKDTLDGINKFKTPLSEVKKAIAYLPAKGERAPSWVEPWVYDTSDDKFFATDRKISTTTQGFNAMYDRKAMTKKDVLDGKTAPASTASALALNMFRITVVNGRRYEPGRDPIFYAPDGVFANTYAEHEIPELPEKLLPRDKRAIKRIKDHIRHLLVKPVEQHIFLDWLSWVVQNPGRHVNWSILLQGTEGDGKSFFGQMMRAVMGVSNVRMMNAYSLEGAFTDWTVGQCLTCVEEVRLIKAANKYEVINKIKPYITNIDIEVHPKGRPQYNAKNTTSYLMFSNFRDALPLDDDGRRYCILFSQWQRRDKLDEFIAANPNYYEELYRTLEQCAPALRKWLLEREQSETFRAMGTAPETEARKFMVKQAQPEFIQILNDFISEGEYPLISDNLLDLTRCAEVFGQFGHDYPHVKAMSSMLSRHRFESLGRIRIDSEIHVFYSRTPEQFQRIDEGIISIDTYLVRDFYKKALKLEAENDEL
jgi:hypothetical protein